MIADYKKSIFFLSIIVIFSALSGGFEASSASEKSITESLHRADEAYKAGSFEQSLQIWEEGLEAINAKQNPGLYVDILTNLVKVYQSLGHYPKALSAFQSGLPIVEKNDDLRRNARFYAQMGDFFLAMGNTRQAMVYLEKAEDLATDIKSASILAGVLNHLGNAIAVTQDYAHALATFQESLDLIRQSNSSNDSLPELESKVLLNIARLRLHMGENKEIMPAIDQSLKRIRSLEDSNMKAADEISLSLLIRQYVREGDREIETGASAHLIRQAFDVLTDSIRIADDLKNDRLKSLATGYLGRLYEDGGQYEASISLTRSAIFHAQQIQASEILYQWQWQLGRLYDASGKTKEAIQSYGEAISTLNPIRTRLFTGYREQTATFSEKIKPVYLGLAELLIEQAEPLTDPVEKERLLGEARDTMELLKTIELQEFFQDECVSEVQTAKIGSEQLGEHTSVVYPIPFKDRLVILLTFHDSIQAISVPVNEKALSEHVKRFRKNLQFSVHQRFMKDSVQLYDWVIRPLEAEFGKRSIQTLVVAPDGILRLMPFGALYDGKHFLIEKFAIATVPAVTLTIPNPEGNPDIRILLEGLSESRQGFAPLPNVTQELHDIQDVMGGTLLLDQDYTLENLNTEFRQNNYDIVHIATHGVFGGNSKDTFLLTHDHRLTMDNLEQLLDMSRYRGHQVELLALSACETALGDERSAFGLAGIAVKAGVSSAIASLWFVDDVATSLVMTEFYRQIKTPGTPKAKALQNAQIKLISQPDYWHPAYWAPFLLIGNWS